MLEKGQQPTNQNILVWIPLLLAVFLAGGIFVGTQMSPQKTIVLQGNGQFGPNQIGQGQIEELIRYIEAKYVDGVEREVLVESAINHLLDQLDPHSAYIPADQLAFVNQKLEGHFDGIGVEFLTIKDTLTITEVLSSGPAEKAGLKTGDRIVTIGDTIVAGVNKRTNEITGLLKGKKGTSVQVGIARRGNPDLINVEIIRGEIPLSSVDACYLVKPSMVYIKINRFSGNTFKEFVDAIEKVTDDNKPIDLIIDLRNNHGGYLQQATNILSQIFKESDKLLVYTEGEHVRRSEYETTGKNFFNIEDVVVLINEESASASEIMAGALQDYDRGVIIGRRSYGKGLVQEQYNLRDGSALRLTVARYYTPSGRSIQRPYEDNDAYDNDLEARIKSGEVFNPYVQKESDTLVYYTQNGRTVLGNGGIQPDIFVPMDSILLDRTYAHLIPYVNVFTFQQIENGLEVGYSDAIEFKRRYEVDDSLLQKYLDFATSIHGQFTAPISESVNRRMKRLLKARIGDYLFGDQVFFQVMNQDDRIFEKAIEVLQKDNPLSELNK